MRLLRAAAATIVLLLIAWAAFNVIERLAKYPLLGSILGVVITAMILAKAAPLAGITGDGPTWVLYVAIIAMSWMMWPLIVGLGALMAGFYAAALILLGPSRLPPRRPRPRPQAPRPESLEDLLSELRKAWERGGDDGESS